MHIDFFGTQQSKYHKNFILFGADLCYNSSSEGVAYGSPLRTEKEFP